MVERLARAAWLTAAVLTLAGIVQAGVVYRAARFNAALQAGDVALAGEFANAYGRFAQAYTLHKRGQFDAAVEAYGAVGMSLPHTLDAAVTYNLANLYLAHALEQGHVEGAADDLTVPLVELAKHLYRKRLRAEPGDWKAKYNLELALHLLPDVVELDPGEEIMPEHSPRAIAPKQAFEQLP